MLILNYADFTDYADISELCKTNAVIFDFKLYDIPATMRRNIKTLAEFGGHAVTIANDPLNYLGITEAKQAGREYGIEIIVGCIHQLKNEPKP